MEALHSFSLIVCATLGDAKAHACLEPASAQAELSTSAALDALQQLALHQQSQSQHAAASNSGRAGLPCSVSFGFSTHQCELCCSTTKCWGCVVTGAEVVIECCNSKLQDISSAPRVGLRLLDQLIKLTQVRVYRLSDSLVHTV